MDAEQDRLRVSFAALAHATANFSSGRKLGEGATGEVFRGELNGALVAVKCLKLPAGAPAAVKASAARRFFAEYGVAMNYKSPRIVQLVGWAENEDAAAAYPYALVFELLEGGSLVDWLNGPNGEPAVRGGGGGGAKPLTPLARVHIALGVAAGLSFLHGQREPGEGEGPAQPVLHRDVKSANVGLALTRQGELYAKLLDFGLSKALKGGGPEAAAGVAASFSGGLGAGTVGYMAPEIADGVYTVVSEVYANGVLLLELLRGKRVGPRTATEARKQGLRPLIESADPTWPKAAAEALAALVVDCLRQDEDARPQSMAAVTARLQQVLALVDAAGPSFVVCCICFENVIAKTGVRCSGAGDGHFVCQGCLKGLVVLVLEPRRLAANGGAVPCPQPGCQAAPWSIEDLEPHLDVSTAIKYAAALRYQLFDAAKAKREAEAALAVREAEARRADMALGERAQRVRLVLIERHLYLKCPRCAFKFDDYQGCNALQCGKCGAGFCAECLSDCGQDAHRHVAQVHGEVYAKGRFQQATRARFEASLVLEVKALLADEGEALPRAVMSEMAKADLPGLNIKADDLLRLAGVGAVGIF